MKHHAPAGAVTRARRLRRDMTKAEKKVWNMLREHFSEFHFRHQTPIRHFIADFVSHGAKLVIEADADRQRIIEAEGYRVIRFWNNDVLGNSDGVFTAIDAALRGGQPHPTLPHQGGGL